MGGRWGLDGGKTVGKMFFWKLEMIWGYFTQLISGQNNSTSHWAWGPHGPPCMNDSHLTRCMTLGSIFLRVDKFNTKISKMLGEFSCFFPWFLVKLYGYDHGSEPSDRQ